MLATNTSASLRGDRERDREREIGRGVFVKRQEDGQTGKSIDTYRHPKKDGKACLGGYTPQKKKYILWMEEILHQLIGGLSHYNPIIYSVS